VPSLKSLLNFSILSKSRNQRDFEQHFPLITCTVATENAAQNHADFWTFKVSESIEKLRSDLRLGSPAQCEYLHMYVMYIHTVTYWFRALFLNLSFVFILFFKHCAPERTQCSAVCSSVKFEKNFKNS
jgi:hypothetical protein